MVLLGVMGQVQTWFGPFGDSVNLDTKIGTEMAPNVPYV